MAYTEINKSSNFFNVNLWTGNGNSGLAITGVDFRPDLTWIKERNQTRGHVLFDVVRGATFQFNPNSNATNAQEAESLKSFDTDGFTVGNANSVNQNSYLYVSWNWLAGGSQGSSNTDGSINTTYTSVNTTSGCSVVQYSANNTAGATVGHGLGVVPRMILVKESTGSVNDWVVYHASLGNTKKLILNEINTAGIDNFMNDTTPTSTVFSISDASVVNRSGSTYMAYCFAEKQGYSKFGGYTGNGSTDGTFVYLGFSPAFLMVKRTNSTGVWGMYDNKRIGYNTSQGVQNVLRANSSDAVAASGGDAGGFGGIDFLSNGFKCKLSDVNMGASGSSYIFMAFAENPFVTGDSATPTTAK